MSMIPSKIRRDSSGSSSEISTPTSLNRYLNRCGDTTSIKSGSFKAIKSEESNIHEIDLTITVHSIKERSRINPNYAVNTTSNIIAG